MAVAWDHRSDVLASFGSFLGVLGARLGLPVLDPIASVLICLLILKVAVDIFRDAMHKMTDSACDEHFIAELSAVILVQDDVLDIDRIRTRLFGDKIYMDVEISVNGDFTLREAHVVAERVHRSIESQFHKVKHCMVHVNPGVPHAEIEES
jgi:cation diffusion facilitator family transporter